MKRLGLVLALAMFLGGLSGCKGIFTVKTEAEDVTIPLTGLQNSYTSVNLKFYIFKKVEMEPESVSVIASSWAYVARSDTPVSFQIRITDENVADSTDYLLVFDTTGLGNYIPSFLLQPFLDELRQLGYSFRMPVDVSRAPILISGNVDGSVQDSLTGGYQLNMALENSINKGEMWVIVSVEAQSNYFPPVTAPAYLRFKRITGHIDVEMDMGAFSPLFYLTF